MNAVVVIVSLFAALSIMVLVHELGHLLAAKRSKVVVEEFGIGYPPRVFTFWRSDGEIVLDGERIVVPRKLKMPEGLRARSLVRYSTQADEKGRQVLVSITPVLPEDPAADTASTVELLDSGTIYSLNAVPFGGFTKMLGEEDPTFPGSLASKSKRTRIMVLAAGSGMNLLAAVLFFSLAMVVGAPALADPENAVVSSVLAGTPAAASGLEPGDVILQADGADIMIIEDLQKHTLDHLGEPIVLTIQRGDQILDITVVPRTSHPPDEGPIGITLTPRTTIERYPWYEALWRGLKEVVTLTGFIITVPMQILRGLIPADLARPVGPVGVGQLVGDAVQFSLDTGWWFPVMQMMGTLSVALALTNLLPLPAMDGGRILFIVVEGVRGRRLDPAKEGMVHLVGMLLLVALMLFITWQDVVNPIPSLDWSSLF
jgi:regulator of sigma E protease